MGFDLTMNADDTDRLLSMAKNGDLSARQLLLERYRPRLRRMIRAWLDPRVSSRVDASDVLQNALTQAAIHMEQYFDRPVVAFFTWLRQITREELIQVHRQHVVARRRSIYREEPFPDLVSDISAMQLAERLVSKEPSPSQFANLNELRAKVQSALGQLSESDREVLLMRCAEHLKLREIAEVLSISETSAKSRLRRALQKLSQLVGPLG